MRPCHTETVAIVVLSYALTVCKTSGIKAGAKELLQHLVPVQRIASRIKTLAKSLTSTAFFDRRLLQLTLIESCLGFPISFFISLAGSFFLAKSPQVAALALWASHSYKLAQTTSMPSTFPRGCWMWLEGPASMASCRPWIRRGHRQTGSVLRCVGIAAEAHAGPVPALQELVQIMEKRSHVVATLVDGVWVLGRCEAEVERLGAVGIGDVLSRANADHRHWTNNRARIVILNRR